MEVDLIIKNAGQLVTPVGSHKVSQASTGMGKLLLIENGAVAVKQGKIAAVGKTEEVLQEIEIDGATRIIDARDKVVLPGFVDCHTHPVFYGTREAEFELRLQGKSYQEIARQGGGIRASVSTGLGSVVLTEAHLRADPPARRLLHRLEPVPI
ncbi:MAG: hypothetical protein ONB05_09850, partial [candidate division KSB1 bacterium]|nr:hypothetical protein [candidate division KSB1 bacterium]